jgi:hypothetical protein
MHELRRVPFWIVIFIFAPLLWGCWIPENFDAKVTVNKDGSYTFTYDGTLTFALALDAAKKGSLSAKDEAELGKGADELRREPGFKRVEYQGKGRYKVFVEKSGKPGEPFYFVSREMQFFAVLPKEKHTLTVAAIRPSKSDIQQLNSMGAKLEGTLSVDVPSGLKVTKQNADSQPMFFGLLGSYKWIIRSPDANPEIVVELSQ